MTKTELQLNAAKRLESEKRLLCQWATGTGKTNVALSFIKNHPGIKTLVIVPEKDNIRNWQDEFSAFKVSLDGVTIACYASLHKYVNNKYDLLVWDEVPHFNTDLKISYAQQIDAYYILALGAVVTEEQLQSLECVYGRFSISKITLQKAIDNNYLPSPTFIIYHLRLDNKEKRNWYDGRQVTDKEKYDIIQHNLDVAKERFDEKHSEWRKQQMMHYGNVRKKFLGETKESFARRICDGLTKRGKRFIVFCVSIEQSVRLGGELSYTSQSDKDKRLLERFNNHEIDSLYVVRKLIEGQNLKDIDCGVIVQLNGKERLTIQSTGRIMRSEKPYIYIPVFDDTKDEDYLFLLTSNISDGYIKHYNF